MKTFIAVFALAAGLVVLAGCSTPASRIKDNPAAYEQLPPPQQQLVKEGKIALGFDMAAVQLAVGKPDRIRTRTEATGESVIWSYVTSYSDFYGAPYDAHFWYGGFYPYRYGPGPYYPAYPYHAFYPYSDFRERENFRVVFQNGKVVMIEKED